MRKNLSKWLASIFAIALSVTMTATPIAQAAIVESSQGESKTAVKTPIEEGDFSEDALIFDSTEEGQNIEIASEESAEEENAKVESEISVEEESIEIDSGELGEADETNSGELGEAEENPSESEDTQTYEMAEEETTQVETMQEESATIVEEQENSSVDSEVIVDEADTIQATTVKKIAEGTCGKNLIWYLTDKGELYIDGTGEMNNYEFVWDWEFEPTATTPWRDYTDKIKKIYLDEGVTSIGAYAFYDCFFASEISIPNSITKIEEGAFYDCSGLVEISIPNSVTSIGSYLFTWCDNLSKVELPETITNMGSYVFSGSGINEITIPSSITKIEEGMFYDCKNLSKVIISNSVTSIGDSAFSDCDSLGEISIPETVTNIEREAFYSCDSLSKISILNEECEIYDSKDTISSNANIYGYAGSTAEAYAEEYGRVFKKIGEEQTCEHDWKEVSKKDATCMNTGYIVKECSICKERETEILNATKDISKCTVEFDELGNYFYDGKEKKPEVILFDEGENQIPFSNYKVEYTNNIEVGEAKIILTGINGYKGKTEVPFQILKDASGTCGKNLKWHLDGTGLLTISGTGAMSINDDGTPWGEYSWDIKKVKIENGVTSIEALYCPNAKSVTLPSTLTSIGDCAFEEFRNLTSITIPTSVKKIGELAFHRCFSLTEIVIPKSVTSIGESAFLYCNDLKSIQILNPSCQIGGSESDLSLGEGVTIYGYTNSTAESYAKKHKHSFKTLGTQANTYIISYNANGGKNAPAVQAKKKGVTLTISKTKPTRKGYTFLGWATSKSSTKVSYKSGASFKSDKNTTLYAVWQANAYKVAFNKNGGTGSMSTLSCVYDKTFTLKANAFKRKGYTFKGWNTKADGTGTYSYADKEKVKNVSSVAGKTLTLYAQWEPNAYKVAFDKNGGTGSMSTVSCVYDKTFTLKANTFKKKGYTFKGWNTKADGTGTYSYADKAKVKNISSVAGKTIKLFAQWEPNAYKVAFDKNGGTGSMSTVSCVYDKVFTLKANAFKRKGYTFKGWNTKADGTGTYSYADKAKVKNVSSVAGKTMKLFAQWEPNEYTLRYDGNGATSGSMEDTKDCQYDKNYILRENAFEREGYTFAGWAKSEKGALRYKDAEEVTNISSVDGKIVVLYAVWEKNE